MKKIAILSTMYYPDMGAPSSVMDRYVQFLHNKYKFYIITKTYKNKEEFEPQNDVFYISGLRHRVTLWCEKNIRQKKQSKILYTIILRAIDVYKLIATQFCHPNANSWENKAYFSELEKLHIKENLDVVVSVSNTCSTQFAANRFKKKYKHVRWVQFVTDPFSEFYVYYRYKIFPSLWKKINFNDEKEFYKNCDAAFLTPELLPAIVLKYPDFAHKCHEMQFTLTDLSEINKNQINHSNSIRLIYAGTVYKDIRNPEFMMRTIAAISDVKLDMFTNFGANHGECDEILLRNSSDNISIFDFVSKDRYNDMICNEYEILVNIGNISNLQSPSKTLDLLSTGRPILNFYFVEDCQFEMIKKYPLGLNICCGDSNAVKKVELFCHQMKGKKLNFEDVKSIYPENVLEHQVDIFERLING